MSLYNVEIFNNKFEYKSSHPVMELDKYEYDYISLSVNKIEIADIQAEKGDYIFINPFNATEQPVIGIVTGCLNKGMTYEVEYKAFLTITDVEVHYNAELLKKICLEQWIADILIETYVSNEDSEQNLFGLNVTYEPSTWNALLGLEENIGNLYDILVTALTNYNVTVEFTMDIANKTLNAHVAAQNERTFFIEADLPNVMEYQFDTKKGTIAYNKLTVYNSLNEEEKQTFFLDTEGNIVESIEVEKRVLPVVFTNMFIEHEEASEETFYEKAYEKAFMKLSGERYNNLIEITVLQSDKIVKPLEQSIGQNTAILHKNTEYRTILTGIEIKDGTVKLMYGMVRRELTKKIKRRMY